VYWYLNKKFVSKAAANAPVYINAVKGEHAVTCVDDRGRSTTISFRVTYL
jgi:membrane carboxypeptidase/penicillin-binding protein PbpC